MTDNRPGGQNRPVLVALANGFRDFISGNPEGTPDPSPGGAELTGIAPTTAVHAVATTVTATGTGFVKGVHEIQVNGTKVSTTFVSATSLTASVNVPAAGTATIRVSGAEGSKPLTVT